MANRPSPSTSTSSTSTDAAEDFKQHLYELTGQWKSLLRRNKKVLLKCPNYEKCQYKCGSIGGMQYHYPRCAGACPLFKCNLCGREYESRTGLNYHNASHHTGVGVVLSSESSKRTQRKDRRTDSSEVTTPTSSPATPVQAPPTSKPTPPPLVSSSDPIMSSSGPTSIPPITFTTTTSTSTHIHVLPSLLKHSTTMPSSSAGGGTTAKGRKSGRGSNRGSNKSTDGEPPNISMEGVVKTSSGKNKKVTVNIPSIEYPDEYRSYLPEWRDELKANQTVLCPNYDDCQFQCTTVNGMKYHFIRCQKDKLPEFSCSLCDRSFHCRSGLVWHLKNTHKLVDIPPNQKSFEIPTPPTKAGGMGRAGGVKEDEPSTDTKEKDNVRVSRKRKPHPQDTTPRGKTSPPPTQPVAIVQSHKRQSPRKNANPRPTAKFYLKYLETQEKPVSYVKPMPTAWYGSPPPTPKLHPQKEGSPLSPVKFTLFHEVETDQDATKSLDVEYSEEILTQWHKWESSGSEGEDDCYDDYDDEAEFSGKGSTHLRRVYCDSSTTCSEVSSDEDYLGFTQAKGKTAGKGRGRGKRRKKGAEGVGEKPSPFIPPIPSLLTTTSSNKLVGHVKPDLQQGTKASVKSLNKTAKQQVVKTTPTSTHLHSISSSSSGSVSRVAGSSGPVPKPIAHEPKPPTTKPVKLVKPLSTTTTSRQPSAPPSSPQKLLTMVGPGKGQSTTGSVITLSPGNYYQLQHVPSATNLVPVQLVSPVQNAYHVPSNGLVLIQQPGSQPQYATLQTNVSTPQKVSVIMNPRHVTMATLGSTSSSHGVITQLDGPKGAKRKMAVDQSDKEQLEEKFERVRKKARLSPDEPMTSQDAISLQETPTKKKKGRKSMQHTTPTSDQTTPMNELTTPSASKRGRKGKQPKEELVCPTCSESFQNQRSYKSHMDTTHLPISPEATIAERQPHWRNSIKKHKYVTCDKCMEYRGKSVTAMKYHYERCQVSDKAQKQTFSCPTCEKTYTSMPGLSYHLKYAHVEPSSSKASSPDNTDPVNSIISQRKAAGSAAKKLREMSEVVIPRTAESENGTPLQSVTEEGEGEPTTPTDDDNLMNSSTKKAMKAMLLKEGVVTCPKEGCEQTYKTMPGLLYHVRTRHMYGKKFRCPQCKVLLLSRKKIVNHMTKKHPDYQVPDYDDLEYIPDDGGGDDSDSDGHSGGEDFDHMEGDFGGKRRVGGASTGGGGGRLIFKMFDTTSYKKMVETLKSRLTSDDPLYQGYGAFREDYSDVLDSDLQDYIPEQTTSIKYDDVNTVNEESIELFKTSSAGNVLFAGGPVWAMDWLPFQEPDSSSLLSGGTPQYVALSAYRKLAEIHSIEDIQVCKGLIQLWQIDDLKDDSDCCPIVKFSLGICHEWGIIRSMKWCPSGTTDTTVVGNETHLSRLGLLAIACTDGNVRLLSVPRPSSVSPDPSMKRVPFIKPNIVSAVLQPCHHNSLYKYGQCLCIDWFPGRGHSKMAAGYSNGSIVIWDLSVTLPFISHSRSSSDHLCHHLHNPIIILPGHNGACRGINWLPCTEYYISSVGHDKALCIWDVRQPYQPIQKNEKSTVQLKVLAPLVWPSLIVLEDLSSGNLSMYLTLLFQSIKCIKNIPVNSLNPFSCIDYNVWSDCVVSGSYRGDIVAVEFAGNAHYSSNMKGLHKIVKRKFQVLSCKLEKLTTPTNLTNERPSCHSYSVSQIADNFKVVFQQDHTHQVKEDEDIQLAESYYSNEEVPLLSITSLSWSPHRDTHHWLMVGMNCGLVKIIRT